MESITTSAELRKAIKELEMQQDIEWPLLREELLKTAESLKLVNIIKSSFKEAVALPDLKTNILNTAIGLATGIVAKKIIIGKTLNPISKLLGVLLEVFVANKATENAGNIKSIGNVIMKKIFNKPHAAEKVL